MRTWIKHSVKVMGEDVFYDLRESITEEAYNFPGDDLWMRYIYPDRTPSRAETLLELRPRQDARFKTEEQLQKDTILFEDTHVTRMFILATVDQIMRSRFSLDFMNLIMVPHAGIPRADLPTRRFPSLVQVFSYYWLHSDSGQVLWSHDIYETITAFLLHVRTHHGGIAHRTNINPLLQELFPTTGAEPARLTAAVPTIRF